MTVYVVALAADENSRPTVPTYKKSSILLTDFLRANQGTFIEWLLPAAEGIVKIDIDSSLVEMLGQNTFVDREHAQPMIGTSAYINEQHLSH